VHVSVDPPATHGTITVTALAGKSAAFTGNTPPNKTMMNTSHRIPLIDLLAIMHLLGSWFFSVLLFLLETPFSGFSKNNIILFYL
jgi:hypothetical protein